MINSTSRGIRCISVRAWNSLFDSSITQLRSWRRLQFAVAEALLCVAPRNHYRSLSVRLSRPQVWTRPKQTVQLGRWFWGAAHAQGGFSKNALWLLTGQKYGKLQLGCLSLAAAGVLAAPWLLPASPLTACSHCQPIHPTAALDYIPVAVWPRMHFYLRVASRMTALLSILLPLCLLYPISCLHPCARSLWLGLLRTSLRWCGPAFTKWGQWASARGDLLPQDVRAILQTLQNAAPAQSHADTMRTLQQSLPMPVDDVFAYIDPEPAGCGAIAQVHRARLTPGAAAICGISPDQVTLLILHISICMNSRLPSLFLSLLLYSPR
jgi:hypothetical protein